MKPRRGSNGDECFELFCSDDQQSFAYGENVLYRNDDGYSSPAVITSIFQNGINIGNENFTSLYVNNNGNITFGYGFVVLHAGHYRWRRGQNIIAPFWADVDTREDVPNRNDGVFWDFNEARDSIVVTWAWTGYFNYNIDRLNTFQLELRDRGDGNMEIIFRYDLINWTTGDASGEAPGGLGGTVARAGFSLGDVYFELPASGNRGLGSGAVPPVTSACPVSGSFWSAMAS